VSENWHEERDRLIKLLKGVDDGTVTHVDQDALRNLQATNPQNVQKLKDRLAKLTARLSTNDAYNPK
jgi:hypothetical protein